uniref:Uncharacterized protein n=1 Tax=Anguilla anguilla TaxID=7936 RepID=A0A0E9VCU8_ANGAN
MFICFALQCNRDKYWDLITLFYSLLLISKHFKHTVKH